MVVVSKVFPAGTYSATSHRIVLKPISFRTGCLLTTSLAITALVFVFLCAHEGLVNLVPNKCGVYNSQGYSQTINLLDPPPPSSTCKNCLLKRILTGSQVPNKLGKPV